MSTQFDDINLYKSSKFGKRNKGRIQTSIKTKSEIKKWSFSNK